MNAERLVLKPSLRNRLLRHVLLPLALTWLLGSALVVGIATYFTQQALFGGQPCEARRCGRRGRGVELVGPRNEHGVV